MGEGNRVHILAVVATEAARYPIGEVYPALAEEMEMAQGRCVYKPQRLSGLKVISVVTGESGDLLILCVQGLFLNKWHR